MKISKGIKLLEEIEGTGQVAKKGCEATYNLRAYLNKGDEININYSDQVVPVSLVTQDDKGKLINFTCFIGMMRGFRSGRVHPNRNEGRRLSKNKISTSVGIP